MAVNRDYKVPNVELVKETDKAILVSHDEFGEAWFPKTHAMVTPKGSLWCSEWIAEQKGWMVDTGDEDPNNELDELESARPF